MWKEGNDCDHLMKVRNKVKIDNGLTQGTKVIGHALHLATVVTDTEIALLEHTKHVVELQNTGLAVAKELGLEHEPRMTSGLCRFPNDLVS
jgi:hypothetical protein